MTELWPADPAHVQEAARRLGQGAVIVFPTETVYGVGARATDRRAVSRLYAIKRRPVEQPVILLVADWSQVEDLAVSSEIARRLMERFWPGALTLILRRRAGAGLPAITGTTLAFRAPAHPVALDLLRALAEPMASSSANRAGEPPPLDAATARHGLGDEVDLVLDGGPATVGEPSTILDLTGLKPRIVRQGAIREQDLLPSS